MLHQNLFSSKVLHFLFLTFHRMARASILRQSLRRFLYRIRYFYVVNQNYNKIVERDWSSTA